MITVYLATGISLLREGLLRVLNEERGISVTALAAHSDGLLKSCQGGHPDVLLLHTELPGEGIAAVLRRLQQRGCTVRVLLFGEWNPERLTAVHRIGVTGLLDARDDAEQYVRAVHHVQDGSMFFSELVLPMLEEAPSAGQTPLRRIESVLTPTEQQIFRALGDNMTSQDIARSMFISYRTVQKHRSNMAKKLHLEGSNSLLAYAILHRGQDF